MIGKMNDKREGKDVHVGVDIIFSFVIWSSSFWGALACYTGQLRLIQARITDAIRLMVPSYSPTREKAAKAAKVRPEQPAIYRRNEFGFCNPNIFAFRYLRWNLCLDLFAPVGQSLPPQKAMTLATRLPLLRGDN